MSGASRDLREAEAAEWVDEQCPEVGSWPHDSYRGLVDELAEEGVDEESRRYIAAFHAHELAERRSAVDITRARQKLAHAEAKASKAREDLYQAVRVGYAAGIRKSHLHKLSGLSRPTVDRAVDA